jgi:hypothetical protein
VDGRKRTKRKAVNAHTSGGEGNERRGSTRTSGRNGNERRVARTQQEEDETNAGQHTNVSKRRKRKAGSTRASGREGNERRIAHAHLKKMETKALSKKFYQGFLSKTHGKP